MSIAYGGIVALVFRGLNLGIAFLLVVLTSNELGADGRGTFVLGATAIGIVSATLGGLTASVAYQVANQRRAPAEVMGTGGLAAVILGALAVVAGVVVSGTAGGDAAGIAAAVGVSAAAVIVAALLAGVYLGMDEIVRYNVTLVLPALASFLAVLLVVFALDRRTPEAAFAGYAAGQWTGVAVLVAAGAWRFMLRPTLDRELSLAMARFAGVAGISSGVSYLNYRADVFIVEHFEGTKGVAIYGNAVYIAESVWQLSGSLALAAYARIASMERAAAAELTTRVMRHTLVLLGLICAVIFAAADVLVALFFEDEFEPMAPALRILLPGTLVFSMAAAFSAFYTYQRGKPWASAVVAGAALVIDVGLAFVLVPAMGVDGAALATTISYVMPTVIALAVFARGERVSPARIFRFGRADVEDYRRLVSRARALLQRQNGEPQVVASEDGQ